MKIGLLKNSDVCYNSLNYFMDCIEKALHVRGIHTQKITDVDMNVMVDEPWSAIVGINQYKPAAKTKDGSFLLDAFNCPVFNILVDPPYHHHGKLQSHMDNLIIYLLDQGHVEYCKKYYMPFNNVEMVYMIGPSGKAKSYEEKEIDVLFAGTLNREEEIINRVIESTNWRERDDFFYLLVKTRLIHPEMTTLQAMLFLLERTGIEYSDNTLKMMMASFGVNSDLYLRMYYRREIVRSLVDAGIRVHVAGKGWENLYPVCPDNLVLEGVLDFEQTAGLIANTKILLNNMPSFKDGIHDRVLTAMQNGAVCVTDTSSYIETHFQNNQDIVLYDLKELGMLPHMVKQLLGNPDQASAIAKQGQRKALSNYTWDIFVDRYILKRIGV